MGGLYSLPFYPKGLIIIPRGKKPSQLENFIRFFEKQEVRNKCQEIHITQQKISS